MNLIPVTFQFYGISANFRAEIKLETVGATWAIDGGGSDFDFGFSCNEGIMSSAVPVSVQSIELTKSTLSIFTGGGVSENAITVTALLSLESDLKSFDGYCVIDDQAKVFVRLGCGPVIEWRRGRVTGNIPDECASHTLISLAIGNWTVGRSVRIELSGTADGPVRWAFGPGMKNASHLHISTSNGRDVPISSIAFESGSIELFSSTGDAGGGSSTIDDLRIEAYIERLIVDDSGEASKPGRIYLSAKCDPGVIVAAQLPGQYPQYLKSAPTAFTLA